MIDHTSIAVKNYDESVKFYDETFKILGFARCKTLAFPVPHSDKILKIAGYGKNNKPSFWISNMSKYPGEIANAAGVHFAFSAANSEMINAWYEKCLELGGKDNGKPGVRPQYHPGYYGAFIIDPSGWRIEAVMHNYNGYNQNLY